MPLVGRYQFRNKFPYAPFWTERLFSLLESRRRQATGAKRHTAVGPDPVSSVCHERGATRANVGTHVRGAAARLLLDSVTKSGYLKVGISGQEAVTS